MLTCVRLFISNECLLSLSKRKKIKFDACGASANSKTRNLVLAELPQMAKQELWCLRSFRKWRNKKFGAQSEGLQGSFSKFDDQSEGLQGSFSKFDTQSEGLQGSFSKFDAQSEGLQGLFSKFDAQSEGLRGLFSKFDDPSEGLQGIFLCFVDDSETKFI